MIYTLSIYTCTEPSHFTSAVLFQRDSWICLWSNPCTKKTLPLTLLMLHSFTFHFCLGKSLPVRSVHVFEDQAWRFGERIPNNIQKLHNVWPGTHLRSNTPELMHLKASRSTMLDPSTKKVESWGEGDLRILEQQHLGHRQNRREQLATLEAGLSFGSSAYRFSCPKALYTKVPNDSKCRGSWMTLSPCLSFHQLEKEIEVCGPWFRDLSSLLNRCCLSSLNRFAECWLVQSAIFKGQTQRIAACAAEVGIQLRHIKALYMNPTLPLSQPTLNYIIELCAKSSPKKKGQNSCKPRRILQDLDLTPGWSEPKESPNKKARFLESKDYSALPPFVCV